MKLLAIFLFSFLFFGAILPAHAEVVRSNDVSVPTNGTLTATGFPVQSFKFSQDGYLYSMALKWGGGAGVTPTTVGCIAGTYLYDRTSSTTFCLAGAQGVTSTGALIDFYYYPTSTIRVYAAHNYDIFYGNYSFRRTSPSTTYVNSSAYDLGGRRSALFSGGFTDEGYDIWFFINTLQFAPDTNAIAFARTPTTTCDFNSWDLTGQISPTTQYSGYGIGVNYGATIDSMSAYDFTPFEANTSSTETNSFGNTSFVKGSDLQVGTQWYARAFVCDTNDHSYCNFTNGNVIDPHEVAYSDIWQFTIVDPALQCQSRKVSGQGLIAPFATSTTNSSNFTCDTNDAFFQTSLCNLFQWLFIPQQSSLSQYQNIQGFVQNKPPFGYYNLFANALTSLSSSSSTTSTLYATVTSSQQLQLTSWSNLSIIQTIRSIFSWFLWIVFAFYIYNRFKNFSLQG